MMRRLVDVVVAIAALVVLLPVVLVLALVATYGPEDQSDWWWMP